MLEYKELWKNAFNFKERASRRDFWMAFLMNVLVVISIAIVLGIFSAITNIKSLGLLLYIYDIAIIIPFLSLGIRRLHDIGKSGWWYLISAIPLVGTIIYLIFLCTDSTEDNQWGPKK